MHDLSRRRVLASSAALAAIGAGARAAGLETMSVGCVKLPTNAPLYIAIDKGFMSREGLSIDIKFFTAAATIFSAVVSGDVDIGMTGTTAATFNLAAKGGFKIIGGTTRDAPHFPLNAFLVSNKAWDSGFTSFAKMGGRRVAMTTAGSTHHYDIGMLAKKYGVPLSSIQLVPLESYGNIIAALQSNQVDGAILPPALSARVLADKQAHFLAWTGDEVPYQQGLIFASPETLQKKHDQVLRFMRGYVEGVRLYRKNFDQVDAQGKPIMGPDAAGLIGIIAKYAGISPQEAESQVTYIQPDAKPDEADIEQQIAFWKEAGMVPKSADFANLFDLSFLPKSA